MMLFFCCPVSTKSNYGASNANMWNKMCISAYLQSQYKSRVLTLQRTELHSWLFMLFCLSWTVTIQLLLHPHQLCTSRVIDWAWNLNPECLSHPAEQPPSLSHPRYQGRLRRRLWDSHWAALAQTESIISQKALNGQKGSLSGSAASPYCGRTPVTQERKWTKPCPSSSSASSVSLYVRARSPEHVFVCL